MTLAPLKIYPPIYHYLWKNNPDSGSYLIPWFFLPSALSFIDSGSMVACEDLLRALAKEHAALWKQVHDMVQEPWLLNFTRHASWGAKFRAPWVPGPKAHRGINKDFLYYIFRVCTKNTFFVIFQHFLLYFGSRWEMMSPREQRPC